ncbi:hypothetical protein [Xanthomonas phage XacN1]|nr:hypothetical protein [Xanthomonas phage XacN1]
MSDREISIKIKTIRVGWVRETVHRRGKKFVYGYWRKPRKLAAGWTIEPVQDIECYHSIDAEQELAAILMAEILK